MLPIRLFACLLLTCLAACGPARPDPGLQPDMAGLLENDRNLRPRPLATLTPAEARRQPVLADAVRASWNARGLPVPLDDVPQVDDLTLQTETGLLPGRLYGPKRNQTPVPVILFFHGGGWVIAGLDAYDATARALAARTGAAVLSVHYRQAPEYSFPAAHDDAVAAYRWLLASARDLGLDPGRVALAGEEAGANLALSAAVTIRDAGLPQPLHLLLITPLASTDLSTPSMQAYPNTRFLGRSDVAWFLRNYAPVPGMLADPRLDLLRADLSRLPRTTVVLAERDPLRSGGEELVSRLDASGTAVEVRSYAGVTHGFFGAGSVVGDARAAQDVAARALRLSFETAPAAPAPLAPGELPQPPGRRRPARR